jgi:hypothetical protein
LLSIVANQHTIIASIDINLNRYLQLSICLRLAEFIIFIIIIFGFCRINECRVGVEFWVIKKEVIDVSASYSFILSTAKG